MYVVLEYSVFSLLIHTKGSCKNLALPKITRFLGFLDGKFREKSKKSNTKSSIAKMKRALGKIDFNSSTQSLESI